MIPLLCLLAPGKGRRRVWDHVRHLEHQLAAAGEDRERLAADLAAAIAERDTARRERDGVFALLLEAETDREVLEEERDRLRGEKTAAWAKRAKENAVDVPAPGGDPESAFYSGEDTEETPIPVMPLHDAPFARPEPAGQITLPLVPGPVVRVTAAPYRDPAATSSATNPANPAA